MAARKTWCEKLADSKDLPKVEKIPARMKKNWGQGTIVIPAPREVDAIMKRVPSGQVITINQIRERLAKKHGATMTCPITTGIFAWIAAHAAEEQRAAGKTETTPYWRTLKGDGELNPKYPGGLELQRELLIEEGHQVVKKGKRFVVSARMGKSAKRMK